MERRASREALRTIMYLLLAAIASAQVEEFDGAGLGDALGQPVVLNAQQPLTVVQQRPVSLQQEQPLGVSSLQSSSYLQGPQTVSLPLQQVPVLQVRPSSATVLPMQPGSLQMSQPEPVLQEMPTPQDILEEEEASMASEAMAEAVMQSITDTLTQPAPHSGRYSGSALQRQHMSDDPSGGGIMEALNRLVESALFPDAEAPALAPAAAAGPAEDALPSFEAPQALASQQAPDQEKSMSEHEPDAITEVEVQQSAADPDVKEVHVVKLQRLDPQDGVGSAFEAQAAAPQVQPRLSSAAMRANTQMSQAQPVYGSARAAQAQAAQGEPTSQGGFEAVPRDESALDSTGSDSTGALDSIAALGNSFRAKRAAGLANEASFQAEVMRELARLAKAPASSYEEIDAPGVDPAAVQLPAQAPGLALAPAPVLAAPQSTARAGVAFNRAPKPHAIPGVSFISSRSNVAGRRLRAAAATHPAVIWQSHLLDVTPQQWNSLKSSYISGIAQGANVGKDQVIILGVTSGSSVTVNTQIIYYNDDSSAAGELKNALADQQSAPVYIPNFGNVQVSGVTQANVPIATHTPAATVAAASYSAYTPATWSAQSPASSAAAPAGQLAGQPGQQQLATPVVQPMTQDTSSSDDSSTVAPTIRRQQVYKNNGLPVGAAVGVPLGAVALAAGLLFLAHLSRKRTARLITEYTEPMMKHSSSSDAELAAPLGALASKVTTPSKITTPRKVTTPPRRTGPSPKLSPKASPKGSPKA